MTDLLGLTSAFSTADASTHFQHSCTPFPAMLSAVGRLVTRVARVGECPGSNQTLSAQCQQGSCPGQEQNHVHGLRLRKKLRHTATARTQGLR